MAELIREIRFRWQCWRFRRLRDKWAQMYGVPHRLRTQFD